MVQIINLKSIGEKQYNKTIEKLRKYVELINSQYHKNQMLNLIIEQENNDLITIESGKSNFIWSFVFDFDFDLQFDRSIIKTEYNTNKISQTVLLSDKSCDWDKDIDLIINLQNIDIENFMMDYLSILDAYRFPNNFDIEDLFQLTRNKKLRYDRAMISNNLNNELFCKRLNGKSPLLYYLKTNELLDNSIQLIVKIEEMFNSNPIATDKVWCILNRNANEISTLTEI